MPSPQFRKRSANDPVTREELQRRADNWARMCSHLDDYAIAGDHRGVRRVLNRLYHSIRHVRARHAIDRQ